MSVEARRAKFVKLANKRVNRTLNNLRLIGNLSNRTNYSYNDEDVEKIVSTLEAALNKMKESFDESQHEVAEEFRL